MQNNDQSTNKLDRIDDGLPLRWDEDRHTLFHGEHVVKKFLQPAPTQQLILAAFEEEGWPSQISDPLLPKKGATVAEVKWRLRSAVNDLNRAQHNSRKIHFSLDGTGQGICWRLQHGVNAD